MLVIRAGIYKLPVRIANREDPLQKQSDLGLLCLSRPLLQATSVRNFRTFAVGNHDTYFQSPLILVYHFVTLKFFSLAM